jgi:TPR repeat protein
MDKASSAYLNYLELLHSGNIYAANLQLNEAVKLRDPLALHTKAYEIESKDSSNIEEALRLYRLAAKQGYEPSMINLARHYEELGNARQYFFWLRKAADLGSPDAISELSRPFRYLVSQAIKVIESGSISEPLKWLTVAARHGNVDALVNLATLYDTEPSLKNNSVAVKLYLKAIENGSSLAAYNLAGHYFDVGDQEKYLKYLMLAAKMGCAQATRELADLRRDNIQL